MPVVTVALFRVAVMIAEALLVTLPVDAVKVAVVELAGTVTDVDTVRVALLDDKATATPPVGAALVRVTVQVVFALEPRLEAVHCRDDRLTAAAWRLILAVAVALFSVAVMLADALLVTLPVDAVKVALVELAGTVTEVGTVRAALLDDKGTVTPPTGAALVRVTVQVVFALEPRLEAVHCRDETLTGAWRLMLVVAVAVALLGVAAPVAPFRLAVMVAEALLVTLPADAVKVAVVELWRTFTEMGTVKLALLDDRATVVPPLGAALDRVTVQEVLAFDAKLDDAHWRDDRFIGA
jgi:hypothetical protein